MRAVQDALGVSNTVVRRIRREEGIPLHGPGPKPETVEQTFARRVQATADGHLIWPGESLAIGTIDGAHMSIRRWVFRKKYHRQPVGKVTADCGVAFCVHPDHIEDRTMREQYSAIFG
jgi:hypothetical protein